MVGIRTVKIKMYNGSIRTLTKVRYVPELQKNLIFFGALSSLGCWYGVEGGVLKVTKGSMVVMKGKKFGNLYKFLGNTITGGASVTTIKESGKDDAKLWHIRHYHMSIQGMQELQKRGLLNDVQSCKLHFCKYCVSDK